MADDFNIVILVGRVTCDPKIQYEESSGTPFTTLCLEVTRAITNTDGSPGTSVLRADVAVWRSQAELCTQFLRAGSRILVSGILEPQRGIGGDALGQSALRVRAQRIQFLEKKAGQAVDAPAEPS